MERMERIPKVVVIDNIIELPKPTINDKGFFPDKPMTVYDNKVMKETRYIPKLYPGQAYVLTKHHGFSNEQLAILFNVTTVQLKNWRKKYKELDKAIDKGMDEFDTQVVERNFLNVCNGYQYNEDLMVPDYKKVYSKDKDGNVVVEKIPTGELVLKERKVKASLPNVKAMTFWLINRCKDKGTEDARWQYLKNINVKTTTINKEEKVFRLEVEQIKKLDPNVVKQLIQITKQIPYAPTTENSE